MNYLVEHKTLADIFFPSKQVGLQLFLQRLRPKLREIRKIMAKFKNSPTFFQKLYIQSLKRH